MSIGVFIGGVCTSFVRSRSVCLQPLRKVEAGEEVDKIILVWERDLDKLIDSLAEEIHGVVSASKDIRYDLLCLVNGVVSFEVLICVVLGG